MSSDDLFDALDRAEQSRRRTRRQLPTTGKAGFGDALAGTSRVDVAKAAKKASIQGQYWLRTLRLPPDYQDLTRQIYSQEPRAKSIADVERWIYTMGLIAYFHEGKRPEYSETIEREINLPGIK